VSCDVVNEYDPFILLYLSGTEFAEMIASKELKHFLLDIKQKYPGYTIVFLIEGLEKVCLASYFF
jgi:hypothetical protein